MNNSKNSESQTTSQASQEARPEKSSYWLTPEEIQELHEDARRTLEYCREMDKKRQMS